MKILSKISVTMLAFAVITTVSADSFNLLSYPSQGAALDTLRSGMFFPGEEEHSIVYRQFFTRSSFYDSGFVYSIPVLKDHPELHYKLWMQLKPAPLVVIIPGLGTNYTGSQLTAFAQLFYLQGCSVVTTSNAFNWEFMQSASTVLTPGLTYQDSSDIYYALRKIISHLDDKYKGRIMGKYLVGYSMGGLETLYIADIESKLPENDKIGFERYLALNPPPDLLYGLNKIDKFYANSTSWSLVECMDKTHKFVKLYKEYSDKQFKTDKQLPFTDQEAEYIIGLVFHMSLVEALYTICQKDNLGVVKTPYSWGDRARLYNELDKFTWQKYINTFMIKYYSQKFGPGITVDLLNEMSGLKAIEDTLKNNPKIRVIGTSNDFLLSDKDQKWLNDVLGNRMFCINTGGHLGYLYCEDTDDLMCNLLFSDKLGADALKGTKYLKPAN